MRNPFMTSRHALPEGCDGSSREGRDCQLSHRLTTLLLFPALDSRPGAWLLFLAAVCSYVAVQALELAGS